MGHNDIISLCLSTKNSSCTLKAKQPKGGKNVGDNNQVG